MINKDFTIFQKKNIINKINDVLYEMFGNKYYIDDDCLNNFSKQFIKNSDEILDENIKFFEIKCPINFLDKNQIVASDDDYMFVKDDLYLNIFKLSNDNINDLINNNIIKKYPYTYRYVDEQDNIEIYYDISNYNGEDEVWLHIIDPDAQYGNSCYFKIDTKSMNISNKKMIEICRKFLPNAKEGGI